MHIAKMNIEDIEVQEWTLKFNNLASYASIVDEEDDDLIVDIRGTVLFGPSPDKYDTNQRRWRFSWKPTENELLKISEFEEHLFSISPGTAMRRWADDKGIVTIKYVNEEPDVVQGDIFNLSGRLAWYLQAGTAGLYFVTQKDDDTKNKNFSKRFGKKIIVERTVKRITLPNKVRKVA